jgi:oligoendopeptidase F
MKVPLAVCLASLLAAPLPAASPSIPDFSKTPRAEVPKTFQWRIEDLFADRAAWARELEALKVLAAGVDPLAKDWTASPARMAALLERLDEIKRRSVRVYAYASLQSDMDLSDVSLQQMKGEVQTFLVDFGARLAFLRPDVLQLGKEQVRTALKAEPRLAPFRVDLERILRDEGHVLSQGEERVAALTGLFTEAPSKVTELLNNVELPRPELKLADGSAVTLDQAAFNRLRGSARREDRLAVMEAHFTNQRRLENSFAALMDANVKQHLFDARIHRFPSCLEAALHANAVDPVVYRTLVSTVRAHLAPLHRLLKLRQRMLGLPELRYGDIYASAVSSVDKRYDYEQAKGMVLDALKPLGADYTAALAKGFEQGWVDVYPNKGKQGGAYSSGVFGVHPYVKMNYDGRYSEVSTLAHEMGHALHSWFSDGTQPFATSEYPIFLAEVASTFNENLLMHRLLATEKDARFKLFLLDRYLEQLRGTLYRQTLFADFELAMHARAEQGGTLTADWMNAKYLELTRLYYGHDRGVMNVDDYIQSEWSTIPHFHYNFYVYQYATGIAASMALSEAVLREGEPARARYLAFLKAGGTKLPLQALKDAGVDLSSPKPVEEALAAFDRLVGEMEALVARLEKTGK